MEKKKYFKVTGATELTGFLSDRPIRYARNRFYRDMQKKVESMDAGSGPIILERKEKMEEEAWEIWVAEDKLLIEASSDLGFIYALLYISEKFMGISPFWFWLEQDIEKSCYVEIPCGHYVSRKALVRYRGWFINDETPMGRWNPKDNESFAWEMAFEALLRCGGNMVIPGSLENFAQYRILASDMGLYITHHHVEPLGAEKFVSVYCDKQPSYFRYPELFERLWEKAIEEQKDAPVIWAIGYRGQDDCPFWEQDGESREKSDAEKGRMLGTVLKRQYEMIRAKLPQGVICTNLYGEMAELYRAGFLEIPDDVIKVWGDNGYGKMVARRRDNHNPRTIALPVTEEERRGHHGIYYHISFFDLQAASHLVMPPMAPEYYQNELGEAFSLGLTDYMVVNCSIIRPHAPMLELLSGLWAGQDMDMEHYFEKFATRYYPAEAAVVADLYKRYVDIAISYGGYRDEVAGEQFYTHGVRTLACQWMKDADVAAEAFLWAYAGKNLGDQIKWVSEKVKGKREEYGDLLEQCRQIPKLHGDLTLQVKLHFLGVCGMEHFCRAWEQWQGQQEMEAFYECGLAAEAFAHADREMRQSEAGIWKNFYENECFADYKFTAYTLRILMGWIRHVADGPTYFPWQKKLYDMETHMGEIITNEENHLTEKEFFERLKKVRQEEWDKDLIVWNRV